MNPIQILILFLIFSFALCAWLGSYLYNISIELKKFKAIYKSMKSLQAETQQALDDNVALFVKSSRSNSKAVQVLFECKSAFEKYGHLRVDDIELANIMKARIEGFIHEYEKELSENAHKFTQSN